MLEFAGVLLFAGAGWFLWGNLQTRELANAAIGSACKSAGLLFLNDTVSLESVWPVRDEHGHLVLRRIYGFEWSDTGDVRRKGTVTVVGAAVSAVRLAPG
jgi:hypothetical protein